jgi:hypothetical protein
MCDKMLSSKQALSRHQNTCIKYNIDFENKKFIPLNNQINELKSMLMQQTKEYEKKISNLQDRLENIALKAIQRPFDEETYIDIDHNISSNENDSDTDFECEIEEYKLSSLNIGEGHTIEHRDEDGYINVTNLCQAGGKKFAEWKRLEKTIAFLEALSSTVQIHTVELIKHNMGGNGKRHTWVHPHVAINIAQWISPLFDVKVSAWVYEAMMTGKVDIANTKTYKEIRQENKTKATAVNTFNLQRYT